MNKFKFSSKRIIFITLIVMAIGIAFVSMYFGAAKYIMPMFISYFSNPWIPILNTLPIIMIILCVYSLSNRVWFSFLLTSCITILISWVNYFKIELRNDPLLAGDLVFINESKNMLLQYKVYPNYKMVITVVAILIITIMSVFLFRKGILSRKERIILFFSIVICSILLGNFLYSNDKLYQSIENYSLANRWNATEDYISRGVVYPFLASIKTSINQAPKGYSKQEVIKILDAYEDGEIADDKKVNIISIMLEGYSDFSHHKQLDFSENPYEFYHQLEKESYTGNLINNVFAGGTVSTERGFLTGYTSLPNFRRQVDTYVWYLRDQGYYTEGSHPYYNWFYNRMNVNPYLGFENYYYLENYYSGKKDTHYMRDELLFEEILGFYEKGKKMDRPYFSFSVTMQNHGPYGKTYEGIPYIINKGYCEESSAIMNNYLQGIDQTTKSLEKMVNTLKNDTEPVVLIIFGDHRPWLGDANSVYHELGINIDLSTEEGFYNYYGTRYLIWANASAKESLDNDFLGEGPDIGSYFLMNEFFILAGYEGPKFMKYSNTIKEEFSVIHSQDAWVKDDGFVRELDKNEQETLRKFNHVQYYLKTKN